MSAKSEKAKSEANAWIGKQDNPKEYRIIQSLEYLTIQRKSSLTGRWLPCKIIKY